MRRISLAVVVATVALAGLAAPVNAQFPYPPIMYPYPGRFVSESDLRIAVKPKEATVYVDGFLAGTVEDFDGTFQRLHVAPGEHEIVVWLAGYRSLKQRLYLSPNKTRKIEGTLEKLGANDPIEPPPTPREDMREDRVEPYGRPLGRGSMPPRRGQAEPDEPPSRTRPSNSTSGTLSIRVQPSGATVLVDGERWAGPDDNDERLIIQIPDGHHRIEVERDGYRRFVTEVDVRRGETVPVNVSLTRER